MISAGDWPAVFRYLCERYHWPPDVVWGLTLPEVEAFCDSDDADSGGSPDAAEHHSPASALATLNARRAERGLPPLELRRPG